MLSIRAATAIRPSSRVISANMLPKTSQHILMSPSQLKPSRLHSSNRSLKGPRIARTQSQPRLAHPQRARQKAHLSEPATATVGKSSNYHPNNTEQHQIQQTPRDEQASNMTAPVDASLHTTAVVPEEPQDVLQPSDPDFSGASKLLSQSALVVTREVEMMNIFLGFEQANKYSLHAPSGELVGYLAEEEQGMLGGALQRQMLRTHRPFRATVMDVSGKPVLMIRRPFTWINSKSYIYAVRASSPAGQGPPQDQDLGLIGEVQQRWHLYKRRYELFLRRPSEKDEDSFEQFAQIDSGLWAWTFMMQDAESRLVGAIDRNFRGFGRELFTDTGQYVLRFDSIGETATTEARLTNSTAGQSQNQAAKQDASSLAEGMDLVQSHGTRPLTLDERAVALATAVSIDFDYFSRHSEGMHSGAGGMFPWFYMGGMGGGGGEAAETSPGTNESQQGDGEDSGFGAGVAGGAVGSGTDDPYSPFGSNSTDDGRFGQPPSQAENYPQPPQQDAWGSSHEQQEGDVWGSGNSDPWAGAGDTQQQEEPGMFSGWGDSNGGGGWGGFFGDSDGGGSDW